MSPRGQQRHYIETDAQRAQRVALQAKISEHNRLVRRDLRAGGDSRLAAAAEKRSRKAATRLRNAVHTHVGNPQWYNTPEAPCP